MKGLNLGLGFLLELALLAALAYWGSQLSTSTAGRWLVAIAAPAALAALWSLIAAPTARRRLSTRPLIAFKLLVFTVGAALLFSTGQHALAIALETVAVVNLGLAIAWEQV
jgi:Na+/melibiose symporter-like transporter